MSSQQPHDTPTVATAEAGEVLLDGPDGVALSMTPKAARQTAAALSRAADEAEAQVAPVRLPLRPAPD